MGYFAGLIWATVAVCGSEAVLNQQRHHRRHHTWYADFNVHLDDGHVGNFTVEVHPKWAPHGASRFHKLVTHGFFNNVRFFRVVPGFMAQFGISGDPNVAAQWRYASIQDDDVKKSNQRGYVSFAKHGPNSRTTQIFINLQNNTFLDDQGFSPIGRVIKGMQVVDALYSGYGDSAPNGDGPEQGRIQDEGNSFLSQNFPKLSFITSVEEELSQKKA